jgi:hypothetical protein
VEGEEAFATAVVAVEESNAGEREALLPEPVNGLGFDFSEVGLVDSKGSD